jgi:glutaminyl-peptide cyclotransferase
MDGHRLNLRRTVQYISYHLPNHITNLECRHLANKWATTYFPPHPKRRLLSASGTNELSTIEHLILLDILGSPNPSIQSYFSDTAWLFDGLVAAELRLRVTGALNEGGKDAKNRWRSFFLPRTQSSFAFRYVGDDHVPFLSRGVSVLHVIPSIFPRVWHTLAVSIYVFVLVL